MKIKAVGWFKFVFLLWAGLGFGAVPEMWTVQLDENIPHTTANGTTVISGGFVLRISNSGKNELTVDLYRCLRFKVTAEDGTPIEEDYRRNATIFPRRTDVVTVTPHHVRDIAYSLSLEKGSLVIPDGSGGAYFFSGIKSGKIHIDVIFQSDVEDSSIVDMERREFGEDRNLFFRGPLKCGRVTIGVKDVKE